MLLLSCVARAEVIINEVMYNPAPSQRNLEYIELYNNAPTATDLSHWAFTDGIHFTFPQGTTIPPNGYLVVCAVQADIQAEYGITNTIGDFWLGGNTGPERLSNSGERVTLTNESGGMVDTVRYRDDGHWPTAPDGAGHSLSLRDPYANPELPSSWVPSAYVGGAPGGPNFGPNWETVIAHGDVWRYFKGTQEPSSPVSAWRQPGFDDGSWPSGPSGFGYNDEGLGTVLDDMRNNYLTVYIRKTFQIDDPSQIHELRLQMDYDDGFAAYLNGTQIALANLTGTAYNSPAELPHDSGALEQFAVPVSLLTPGVNTLAIQGHNVSLSSSDLAIIPTLLALTAGPAPPPSDIMINEIQINANLSGWVELYNQSDAEINLQGYWLSDSADFLRQQRILTSLTVPARGFALQPFTFTSRAGKFFLSNTAADQVVAGCVFDNPSTSRSTGRYPDGGREWYLLGGLSPGLPNPDPVDRSVVINEIMFRPFHEPVRGEYVELYNRGASSVDLSNWYFGDGIAFTFAPGTSIPAGGYRVLAKDRDFLRSVYSLSSAMVLGNFEGRLSNSGERLALYNAEGNLINEVHYFDEGNWPVRADGGGSSLELRDPHEDNNHPANWGASNETQRTTWRNYIFSGDYHEGLSQLQVFLIEDGSVLIDNIQVLNQGGGQHMPNGGFEANLNGWVLGGNHANSLRVQGDASQGNWSLRVLSTGRGQTDANQINIALNPPLIPGQRYTISVDARWEAGSNLLCIRTNGGDINRVIALPVPQTLGTPGRVNSRHVANIPPRVSDVRRQPVSPAPQQTPRITALVQDRHGVDQVLLRYKRSQDAQWQETQMLDNGQGADESAADDIFSAYLPAFAEGTLVEYYIVARDGQGAEGHWPPLAPWKAFLYQVEATPPVGLGRLYQILLRPADLDFLENNRLSDLPLPGTLVVDNRWVYHDVGIRYRGSPFARPNGYRVRLYRDNPLRRTRALNLDGLKGDPTYQHERLTFMLMRKLGGIPTPRNEFVRVRINTGSQAASERVQRIDGEFIDAYYPDGADGPLHKVDEAFEFISDTEFSNETATLEYRGTDKERYRWHFSLRTNESRDDYNAIIDLCEFMDPTQTSDSQFDQQVELRLDLDAWLRVLAGRAMVESWDTLGFWRGKNAFLYQRSDNNQWVLLPWDDDLSWSKLGAFGLPIINDTDPGIHRMLTRPWIQRRYLGLIKELVEDHFTNQNFDPTINANYAILGKLGAAQPDRLRDYITERRQIVQNHVLPTDLDFTVLNIADPRHVATGPVLPLQGKAPFRIWSLAVNGEALDATFPDINSWESSLTLLEGLHTYTIQGLDRHGHIAAQHEITVLYLPNLDQLPIQTGFETDEVPPFVLGPLPQFSWQGQGHVSATHAAHGEQSLRLDGPVERPIATTGVDAVWLDFALRTAGEPYPASAQTSQAARLVYSATAGVLALDGNGQGGGTWHATGVPAPANNFLRVTLRLDYVEQQWDLYLDGMLRAQGLGFAALRDNPLRAEWDLAAQAWLDQVTIDKAEPANLSPLVHPPWSLF